MCRQHNHIRTLIIPEHHRPAVEDNRCGRHTQSQAPYSRSIPFLHHTRSTPAAPGDIPEAQPQASFVHYPSKCSNETSDKDSWMERRRGVPGYIPGPLLMAARLFRDLSPSSMFHTLPPCHPRKSMAGGSVYQNTGGEALQLIRTSPILSESSEGTSYL